MAPVFGLEKMQKGGIWEGSVHPGVSGRKGLQPLGQTWNHGPQAARAGLSWVLADTASWSVLCEDWSLADTFSNWVPIHAKNCTVFALKVLS